MRQQNAMNKLGIIGGTGLTAMKGLNVIRQDVIKTPYGDPSAPLTHGTINGKAVLFLPRHGAAHTLPPHKINYRANIWALKNGGVTHIMAIAAVGGIPLHFHPQTLVIPDQIIDYTHSRINTYFEEGLSEVTHIDFSEPYSEPLRQHIITACDSLAIVAEKSGVYAATQGPRLETAAEINRLEKDGCHIVGMTGMPEAALARELNLSYATLAVVANLAAGRSEEEITMKMIQGHLSLGIEKICQVIREVAKNLEP